MKKLHKIIAASLLASVVTAGSGVVLAETSANVAVSSNYIWRGVTQTGDLSAVSGGIDYASDAGLYAGVWVSNLGKGAYEQDLYAGYGFSLGGVDLDLGYISYLYPLDTSGNFEEVYLNASMSFLSLGYANDSKNKSTYTSASVAFEVKKDLTLGLTAGNYDFDGTGDYAHTQVSLSKGDFTFAYDKTDQSGTSGEPRVTVSWGQSFDL